MTPDEQWDSTYAPAAFAIIAVVTLLRVILLADNPLNLYFDEAQYWVWAQTPDFGYFSKPPLIAWLIGATTHLFGDSEFAVRLASPLIHAITSAFVFVLARDLYDARTAFWSAVLLLTLPAVTLSSAIISTDVPLLCAWAGTMVALHRAIARESYAWAAAAGAAIGIGLLAKYAMGYAALCLFIYAAFSLEARKFLLSGRSLITLAVAAAFIWPNILWNMSHGFATVTHTASNANWGSSLFNWDELLDFLGSQFGVFGPLLALMLGFGIATLRTRLREAGAKRSSDLYLLSFSLPILLIVATQSFISRANANWAAPAYIAATVLVTAWALRILRPRILSASLWIHVTLAAILYAAAMSPPVTAALDSLTAKGAVSNSFKRMKGWDETGRIVAALASSQPYRAILSDDREDISELFYYVQPRSIPILMWDNDGIPEDHFELAYPLKADPGGRVLFITRRSDANRTTDAFAHAEPIASISVDIGGGRTRDFHLFDLETMRPRTDSTPR